MSKGCYLVVMRKFMILSLVAAAMAGSVGAMQGHYDAVAREMQIQRTPSAEILKIHAMHEASAERALEQPALPGDTIRRQQPVAYYFTANVMS